jgi:hypothetical protein
MSQIYSSVRQVVAWLGEAVKDRDKLLNALAQVDPSFYFEEYSRIRSRGKLEWPEYDHPRLFQDPSLIKLSINLWVVRSSDES